MENHNQWYYTRKCVELKAQKFVQEYEETFQNHSGLGMVK